MEVCPALFTCPPHLPSSLAAVYAWHAHYNSEQQKNELIHISNICSQHHSFYDFIVTKARGKSGEWLYLVIDRKSICLLFIYWQEIKKCSFLDGLGVGFLTEKRKLSIWNATLQQTILIVCFFRTALQLWCTRWHPIDKRCYRWERWGNAIFIAEVKRGPHPL